MLASQAKKRRMTLGLAGSVRPNNSMGTVPAIAIFAHLELGKVEQGS